MRVVIVEDDPHKVEQLSSFVQSRLADAEIVERRSYQSGLSEILDTAPDLILLDMTIPTYDVGTGERGGRIRPFGGENILRQLHRKGIETKVVVVTQFESFGEGSETRTLRELKGELKERFPNLYVDTVYYNPSQSDWKQELRNAIDKAWAVTR